jgi:hypothetical protein
LSYSGLRLLPIAQIHAIRQSASKSRRRASTSRCLKQNRETMKNIALLALAATALSAQAATNVDISIGITAPGQYGRIFVDNYDRRPVLVTQQPIVVSPSRVAAYQRPIYLYVPHTHQSDWNRYCGRYSACGQPVYFVQEHWVRDEYRRVHDVREEDDHGKKFKNKDRHGKGHSKGRGRGHDKHGD